MTEPPGALPYSLALIPPPPSPPSFPALNAAYGPALSSIFSSLFHLVKGTRAMIRIDIAIATSDRIGVEIPRAELFTRVQTLFATAYRLICTVSARTGIELDGPGGVDARVFLLDQSGARIHDEGIPEPLHGVQGPIINLPTLARSGRHWDQIFAIESEEGESLLRRFLKLHDSQPSIQSWPTISRVIGGIGMVASNRSASTPALQAHAAHHHSVAVGGTFDHLHVGHKLLLTATALAVEPGVDSETPTARKLTIGITGEELLTKKRYAEVMESWNERQEKVADFLESIITFSPGDQASRSVQRVSNPGPNGTFVLVQVGRSLTINYVQIMDPYGPTITEETISALVISAETRAGGKAVNDKREEKDWPALEVFEVDVLDSRELDEDSSDARQEDFQSKISSTEIRRRRMEELRV